MVTALPIMSRISGRRRLLAAMAGIGLGLALAACGGEEASDDWSAQAIAAPAGAPVTPILVNSRVGVGETRLAFAFFDGEGALLNDATAASVRLFTLQSDTGSLVSEHPLQPARFTGEGAEHRHGDGSVHLHEGPVTTVYSTVVELASAEWWGAELAFEIAGDRHEELRLRFFVLEATEEPAVGEAVPPSRQLTAADVDDLALIDTSPEPNPALHELTVAAALESGRPSVIAFATPLFCQTRFCGPVVDQVVAPTWERYGERVNVIHIEPYDVAEARGGRLIPVPAMQEWGLQTEPWVFVVDAEGRLIAKFEGIMSFDEVAAAVEAALAAGAA